MGWAVYVLEKREAAIALRQDRRVSEPSAIVHLIVSVCPSLSPDTFSFVVLVYIRTSCVPDTCLLPNTPKAQARRG